MVALFYLVRKIKFIALHVCKGCWKNECINKKYMKITISEKKTYIYICMCLGKDFRKKLKPCKGMIRKGSVVLVQLPLPVIMNGLVSITILS
jgi:hypothetical protein